jgi:hypothetical protein
MTALDDEKARLAAREKNGMPTAGAATATSAAMGTAGTSAQTSLTDRLKAITSGGPTAGTTRAYAANEDAKRAMMATAFGKPGGNLAHALRATGNQGTLMDAQTARQADIIRAQEQQAALGQYAQLGTAMHGADIAEADEANRIAMANAGFAQQSAFTNQDAALRWQQMNDAQKRALLGMGIDAAQSDFDSRLGYYGALRGNEMAWVDARKQQQAAGNARDANLTAKILTMGMGGKGG